MLKILDLPCVKYKKAWALQLYLHSLRKEDKIPDVLILLEHHPVITLGRFGKEENLLKSIEELNRLGIDFYRIERGGDITYHGPGQLVGYFIFKINKVKEFIYKIERSIQELLRKYGINSEIIKEYPGVWVGNRKICAIGLAVKNHVSLHGFALNVNNDLQPFSYIIPCGLKDKEVTSMLKELKIPLHLHEVKRDFINAFTTVFGFEEFQVIKISEEMIDQNPDKLLEVLLSP